MAISLMQRLGGNRASEALCQRAARGFVVALVTCRLLQALNPSLVVSQYIHSGWAARDGFGINSVMSMAQTTDGYLWLGTDGGLVRFDGTNFTKWIARGDAPLVPRRVTSLLASRDGGLWIGTENGIARLDRKQLIQSVNGKGPPAGMVLSMLEDHSGALWVGTSAGLAVLRSGSWEAHGVREGLPHATVYSLVEDGQNRVWIGTARGLCQWAQPAEAGCRTVGIREPVFAMQRSKAEELVLLGGHGPQLLEMSSGRPRPLAAQVRTAGFRTLLLDRDGNLWVGTFGEGLLRIGDSRVDRFTQRDGLSGDLVQSLFEDREGNIWVGTNNGLDRFREPKAARVSTIEGLSGNLCTAVCSTRDGSVWVGISGLGLDRIRGRSISHYSAAAGLGGSTVFSLHEDERGTLWAGTTSGLFYKNGSQFIRLPPPIGLHADHVVSMADRDDGALWVADVRTGLLVIKDGKAQSPRIATIPAGRDIYQLYADAEGRLWAGYYQGGVSILGKTSQYYPPGSGLAGGAVESIYEDSQRAVWVGTTEGLSRFRDGRWTAWSAANGLPRGDVQGMVETAGSFWLASSSGLVRLDRAGLDACSDGAPKQLTPTVFGPADGIHPTGRRNMVNPRIALSADGRIWIGADDGLTAFDLRHIRVNPNRLPVLIEQVLVDGKPLDFGQADLHYWGRDVQIEFAAISLTMPEAVRFRHKLEGLDGDWSASDNARRIVYSNLPPGRYRFTVVASNNDGIWNDRATTLDFERRPYFYQTRLFYAFCICGVGLAIYAAHFLRLRTLQARFRLALQERSRMARELHDTLLQGFAGVVYFLAAASRSADRGQEIDKNQLRRAVEQADQSLKEAREAISCMRLTALENNTLSQALIETGNQIVKGTPIRFRAEIAGLERQLQYEIQANLYVIAREAINNATTHARPKEIFLELTYRSQAVDLRVRDDGDGFDPVAVPTNHWGVIGMRERAKHIGARLEIVSSPGGGTTVQVSHHNAKA